MLSVLFGKNADNPLSDMRAAQALVDELPKNDAFASLSELSDLVELLSVISVQNELKLDHQFAVLRLFDESAQPYVRKLVREYFVSSGLDKFQENQLWLTLGNWSAQVAEAYFRVFTSYCSGEKGSVAIKPHLPLLVARAVHAILWRMKYVCSHHGQIDSLVWTNLALLFKHAEQYDYLDAPVQLYPGMIGKTTVKSEIGVLMVWFDCGPTALSPLNLHLVERLLAHYRLDVDIRPELNQYSRLSFVLTSPSEPTRINLGETIHPAIRFIGMPTMHGQLEKLKEALKNGIVPEEIDFGGSYDVETVRVAAQFLFDYVVAPPVRRNKRRLADVVLNVVDTFDELASVIGLGQKPVKRFQTSQWVTEEISAAGFSAKIPASGNDSIGIGSLLGIQPEGRSHWGVAVIRRALLDEEKNELSVGVEILSSQVTGVILDQVRSSDDSMEEGQSALWLYERQNNSTGEIQLLMRAGTFSPARSLKLQLFGKNYLLLPNGLQEKGLNYDLAKFRFVVQESGED